MSNLTIESDVPLPKSTPEILAALEPGQSVLISHMTVESVHTTVTRLRRKFKSRRYKTVREGAGLRVFRTK